jgi:DNA-binding response OmpR family regulator
LRKHLLIVEDYQQLRDLMQEVLSELCGHAVATANDAESAVRLASSQVFDLVVLDIGLASAVSGWDIATLVRARRPCPILFISGQNLDPAALLAYVQPSDDWLQKPFRIEVLTTKVADLLKGGEARVPVAS